MDVAPATSGTVIANATSAAVFAADRPSAPSTSGSTSPPPQAQPFGSRASRATGAASRTAASASGPGATSAVSADPPQLRGVLTAASAGAAADPQAESDSSQDTDGAAAATPLDLTAAPVGYDGAPVPPQATATGASTDATAGSPTAAQSPTLASLSAEIVNRANQPTSRFDVTLNPEDLGRVDVRLQIRADGRLSAALTFGKSEAASSLSARVDELRASLAKAGFDVAHDALTFRVDAAVAGSAPAGGQSGQGGGAPAQGQDESRGRNARSTAGVTAFAAGEAAELPLATGYGGASARGLDIRV